MAVVPINRDAIQPRTRKRAQPAAAPPDPASIKSDKDYEVGYRRPPKHSQFKPGQSGNPKGRPKRARSFRTIIREAMLAPATVRTGSGVKKVTRVEALVMKAIESGTKGDLRAIEKLLGWFAAAMPEAEPERENASAEPEALTATDEAMLATLRDLLRAELRAEGDQQ